MDVVIPRARPRRRQRGDILLVSLVFLLLFLLAVLTGMRSGLIDTFTAGNTLARQKDVQVADVALRQIESLIQTASGGTPLEVSAYTQGWYRDVPAGTAAPSGTYWDTCTSGTATASTRCGTVSLAVGGTTLPYTAYVVVQPTGASDQSNCPLGTSGSQETANYYDVFVHVKEANSVTVATIETIYRLCAP